MKITDFKLHFNDIDTAVKAAKMFELRKQISASALSGKFSETRKYQKQLAHEAINDFETYKSLPFLHIKNPNMSFSDVLFLMFTSAKNKFLYKFSKKTPEEKQFNKMCKEHFGKLTPEEIKKQTIDITIPSLF